MVGEKARNLKSWVGYVFAFCTENMQCSTGRMGGAEMGEGAGIGVWSHGGVEIGEGAGIGVCID